MMNYYKMRKMDDAERLLEEEHCDNSGCSSSIDIEYNSRISIHELQTWKDKNSYKPSDDLVPSARQITLTWCDLSAFVVASSNLQRSRNSITSFLKEDILPNDEDIQILKNVSGVAYPGELLVFLGPSGAGKTTLLNCITFRNLHNLRISGLVCMNGEPVNQTQLASKSAYMQQEDIFIGYLSVKEHLIFQALVRMDSHFSYAEKLKRVEKVMEDLSLTGCAESEIGVPGVSKCISGGERKRLALASELLTNPSLLFCDEPTTGLDSFMALNVLHQLKFLAETGRTVIISLHQPSSELFAMFDKVCLITEGRLAFLGTQQQARQFFFKLGAPCPPKFNPADYYLRMLSVIPGRESFSRKYINCICDTFETCSIGMKIQKLTSRRAKPETVKNLWREERYKSKPYKISWVEQFKAVTWRSWISAGRNPQVLRGRLLQMLFFTALISILYWNQKYNCVGVQNIDGALFLILTNAVSINFLGVIFTFFDELPLFFREHKSRMYSVDAYFLSKLITDFLLYSVMNVFGFVICYFSIGLYPQMQRLSIAVLIIVLTPSVAMGIGYFTSIISTSVEEAFSLTALIMVPFILFSGVLINIQSIPPFLQWLSDISWYRYGYETLIINQWDAVTNITCRHISQPFNGTLILEQQGYSEMDFWYCITLLGIISIVCQIIPYLTLLYKASRKV